MGDQWTRGLHGIGVSDDSGSYMSIIHYGSIFNFGSLQFHVLHHVMCGDRIAISYTRYYTKGGMSLIYNSVGSLPTTNITLGSSLLGRGYLRHQLADRESISAGDGSQGQIGSQPQTSQYLPTQSWPHCPYTTAEAEQQS